MKIPRLRGLIARRILANFRVEADVAQRLLPAPFRPKLHDGFAVAGICLIRLEAIRPAALPLPVGLSSENAAHRFAIEWNESDGTTREGVFIPRRDTGSSLNAVAGGRLFPGEHQLADFRVEESGDDIEFTMRARDDSITIYLRAKVAENLPAASIFGSLKESSKYFEGGSRGYSVRRNSSTLDGIALETQNWRVLPLEVTQLYSSFFANKDKFPTGSVTFDHALLMRDIEHQWHSLSALA